MLHFRNCNVEKTVLGVRHNGRLTLKLRALWCCGEERIMADARCKRKNLKVERCMQLKNLVIRNPMYLRKEIELNYRNRLKTKYLMLS